MCYHRHKIGRPCLINTNLSPTIVRQESQACLSQLFADLALDSSGNTNARERPVGCSYTIESAAATLLQKV